MEAGRLFAGQTSTACWGGLMGISGGRLLHEVSKCCGAVLPGPGIDRLLFLRLLLGVGCGETQSCALLFWGAF